MNKFQIDNNEVVSGIYFVEVEVEVKEKKASKVIGLIWAKVKTIFCKNV